MLVREIDAIQELLDEQPDSKCELASIDVPLRKMFANFPLQGCLESIVHYKRLLLRDWASDIDVEQLRSECADLLKRLERLDPMRCMRYRELGASLFKISDVSVLDDPTNTGDANN